jgi:putative nucleotidyltransferase with HDIG domain
MSAGLSQEPCELLRRLGAPERLLLHAELVSEAAGELLTAMRSFGLQVNEETVRLGAALHDAGKSVHPNELDGQGKQHEEDGEKLLLQAGVPAAIARCCVSHARYGAMEVSFEELLVALSDKLWKGKRDSPLELRVIDEAAKLLNKDRWDLFCELDNCFERIASQGSQRLARNKARCETWATR